MITLEATTDSCAVFVSARTIDVAALGGSICGTRFEHAIEDYWYAILGEPSNNYAPDPATECWRDCINEIEAAGLDWEEV